MVDGSQISSLIANITVCEDSTRKLFDIMYIVGYSLCIIFIIIFLRIHYSLRHAFHPVFSLHIALLYSGYVICELSVVVHFAITLSTDDSLIALLNIIDMVRFVVYTYLLPVVFISTIERLAATILVKRYESMRPWGFVAASQILCASLIAILNIFLKEGMADRMRTYMAIVFEVCIYVVIITLLLVNRKRVRQRATNSYTKLTSRYQLTENIRACRFLLIFVFIDSLITMIDASADVFFNISTVFDPLRCADPRYLPTFAGYHLLTIFLEMSSPWVMVLYGHESYRKRLRKLVRIRKISIIEPGKMMIRNVLGEQVHTTNSTDQYFSQLTGAWDRVEIKTKK